MRSDRAVHLFPVSVVVGMFALGGEPSGIAIGKIISSVTARAELPIDAANAESETRPQQPKSVAHDPLSMIAIVACVRPANVADSVDPIASDACRMGSSARWAYRCVVVIFECPSSLPTTARF